MGNRSPSTSLHFLDDDSILNILHFCRPVPLDEHVDDDAQILQGGEWGRERWWYKLAQVCRRWRYLILGSTSRLRLCLLCTHNTPITDILTHSPPLPLVIDHMEPGGGRTVENEEGMLLALQHRDRIRRVRISWPIPNLQRFFMAMDGEFPMLEYLYVAPSSKSDTSLVLPHTFQAPHLRYLILIGFAFPIGRPLFPTSMGIVTLSLQEIDSYINFRLNDLFHLLSLLPQLESLTIGFNAHVVVQPPKMSNMTHLTLPNLHHFAFEGISTYLEMLLPRMTTPLLEKLRVHFFNFLSSSFTMPCLRDFMSRAPNLRFNKATLTFYAWGIVAMLYRYPRKGSPRMYAVNMHIFCGYPNWQVSSVARIFTALSPALSDVVDLTLGYSEHVSSSEWPHETDRTRWRALLRSFHNVKTLLVYEGLTRELSRSLRPVVGESCVDLLRELKELEYFTYWPASDAFSSFVKARQLAGFPVTLMRL